MTTCLTNPKGFLLFALLACACLAVMAAVVMPELQESAHASLHTEAAIIRQCAHGVGNPAQVWLNKSGERLNCLVQLPDGRFGDQVIQWSCKQLRWLEITSYIIGDGSLAETIRVLEEKGCTKVYP